MNCTTSTSTSAIPLPAQLLPHLLPLRVPLEHLAHLLEAFAAQPPSPLACQQLELDLRDAVRSLARAALEQAFNHLEPAPEVAPAELRLQGSRFRCRGKSPTTIHSLFGPLRLHRLLYESRDGGPCLFPLQHTLGLVAEDTTPALACRVGFLVAGQTQRDTLAILREQHGVHWSATTLRKVAAAVSEALEPCRQANQAAQVLDWLRQARRGKGKHAPVLVAGRDGITLDKGGESREVAGVGTLSVYNRQGRRLGTVYLACMPQTGQTELSQRLTELLQEVLLRCKGHPPRLAYVTDAGATESGYYEVELRRMKDPVTGDRLSWVRVVDYYHATKYVGDLADALFGETAGGRWARRMRRVLKEAAGVSRVLQSASALRNARRLRGERLEAFHKAHRYLWSRSGLMRYAQYRAEGIPMGSGVTEAGCKVVVTQRMKQSGMRWSQTGGQVVLNLRCVRLSGVWRSTWRTYLTEHPRPLLPTYDAALRKCRAVAS